MLHKLKKYKVCSNLSQMELVLELAFQLFREHKHGYTFFNILSDEQKSIILKDLGHNLAWAWFDKQAKEKQDKILKDVEYSVTIWYNRKGEEWQQELEDFVEASIGHNPEI